MNIQFGVVTFSCLPFIYLSCSAAGMFNSLCNEGSIVHITVNSSVNIWLLNAL